MRRDPDWMDVKLIQEELNCMRKAWETFKSLALNKREGTEDSLRKMFDGVKKVERMVSMCMDGRAPYILHERGMEERRRQHGRDF